MAKTETYDVKKIIENLPYGDKDLIQWMFEDEHPSVTGEVCRPSNTVSTKVDWSGWVVEVKVPIRYNPNISGWQEQKKFVIRCDDLSVGLRIAYWEFHNWKKTEGMWESIYPETMELEDNHISIVIDKDMNMVSRWEMNL